MMGGEITLKTCMPISLITGDIKNTHADSPNHGRYVLLKKIMGDIEAISFPLRAHNSAGSQWHVHESK
jgi:hypothetical protein